MCIYAPQVNFLRSASDEKMICVARIPQVQGMVPTTTKSFIFFIGCHTAMLMGNLYENKRGNVFQTLMNYYLIFGLKHKVLHALEFNTPHLDLK